MRIPVWVFLAVFTLSGFAGLIYESIWSQYLKLMLGHAAYAQTLVLAIFMGGMALGAWLCGKFAHRIRRALLGYAIAELAIGLLALSFHSIYTLASGWLFGSILPSIGSGPAVDVVKWCMGALLILPASVLLGTTFPLMSTAIMRAYRDADGRILPALYFANSFGAAAGVLAAGFLFIPAIGLPGAILSAGLLNILLAIGCWAASKSQEASTPIDVGSRSTVTGVTNRFARVLLAVALVTGVASFMYEIAWIRMLSMAIGASTHSFEVMLSAFILGIAIGGGVLALIRRMQFDPVVLLVTVLLMKAIFAILAVISYTYLLDLVQWLIRALGQTDNGYALYLVGSYAVAGLMMLPAAICAGMTLPLITQILLKDKHGEGAIGKVYAINTLGAILGTLTATHIGMELLGLKGITVAGSVLEVIAALAVLTAATAPTTLRMRALAIAGAALVIAMSWFARVDHLKMASGVFRFGDFLNPASSSIEYYKDGKTASVAVVRSGDFMEIRTNGKTDAALAMVEGPWHTTDEHTMWMLGVLPQLYVQFPKKILNIGFGSGLTTHASLGNPAVEVVHSIEIESAMVEGARKFLPVNSRAFEDPRSLLIVDDAKAFLASSGNRYDIIISEPSNPWISGVSSLFSREYYKVISSRLNPGGVLAQWIQLYDTDPRILMSVLKALGSEFEDYVVYMVHHGDAVIIASPKGPVTQVQFDPFRIPQFSKPLADLGYSRVSDFALMRATNRKFLEPLVSSFGVSANSDYFPIVDHLAPAARFKRGGESFLDELSRTQVSVSSMSGFERLPGTEDLPDALTRPLIEGHYSKVMFRAIQAAEMTRALRDPRRPIASILPAGIRNAIGILRATTSQCLALHAQWLEAVEAVAVYGVGWISSADLAAALEQVVRLSSCRSGLDKAGQLRVRFMQGLVARDAAGLLEASTGLLGLPQSELPGQGYIEILQLGHASALVASGQGQRAIDFIRNRQQFQFWLTRLNARLVLAHAQSDLAGRK